MKYMLTCGVFIVLLSLPLADASAEGVSSVVGVEAGYGYLFSSKGMDPQSGLRQVELRLIGGQIPAALVIFSATTLPWTSRKPGP